MREMGKYLAVFVEGEGHDAVGGPESLLDAVAVVHVDVDVQHARVVAEELQDGEHDVVDVAEAGGFGLLGMVQAAGPVDGDEGLVVGQFAGRVEGGAGVEGGVGVETVEDGAVVADVEAVVVGGDGEVVRGGSGGKGVSCGCEMWET